MRATETEAVSSPQPGERGGARAEFLERVRELIEGLEGWSRGSDSHLALLEGLHDLTTRFVWSELGVADEEAHALLSAVGLDGTRPAERLDA